MGWFQKNTKHNSDEPVIGTVTRSVPVPPQTPIQDAEAIVTNLSGQESTPPAKPSGMYIEYNVVNITARSRDDAKIVLQELKIKKKEIALQKKELLNQQRIIRECYTDSVRRRSMTFRGRGGIPRFIRTVQAINHKQAQRQLARNLSPLSAQREQLEMLILALEKAIIVTEKYINAGQDQNLFESISLSIRNNLSYGQ